MFTATRLAALTAVLALTGSLALVAGPLTPTEPGPPPAAEAPSDSVAPAHFTGTVTAWQVGAGERELLDDREIERLRRKFTAEMSDARVSGQGEAMHYYEGITDPEGGTLRVTTDVGRLANDQGSYAVECEGAGVGHPDHQGVGICWLAGEDAYEGLTAFMILTAVDSSTSQVDGWVYQGERPPLLEFEP